MSRAGVADECEATYALGALLGSGSFAAVRRGVHRTDGSAWAVKIVTKAALSAEDAAGALPARARAVCAERTLREWLAPALRAAARAAFGGGGGGGSG